MESGSEKVARYKEEGISRVKLGLADIDGVLRGKYISLDKFEAIAGSTSGFCDCVLGWDVDDQLYDNATYTGWHTAFPDALYRLDLTSERRLADEGGMPYFIGEFVADDGASPHPICPRQRLKQTLALLAEAGFAARMSFEYEFFVFDETPHSIREKNYQNLVPLSPGNFGYSVLRTNALSDLFNEFMDHCDALDLPLEGLHCETGPGVWEAAIAVDDALAAADKAALFKTFTKSFFQRQGMVATFMAKWSMDYPGQSGHCHQSLIDLGTGKNAFFDPDGNQGMSAIQAHYVAGLQKYLRPFLAMTAPTINSYTRLVKGAWAPTAATWGFENRTTALRVIRGSEKSQRVEFRLGSADANPYLVACANLASGLLGIQGRLELGSPVVGNAYAIQDELPGEWQLPGNLRDATRAFSASREAREVFGDTFVDHFVASREWEVREYERHVNDWQLRRYFEVI
ncbi:MAG: glutamine synthetase [Pseudomonadales bacterium]|nr:glutamine synthetase [Pseudomonadales bacterium]